MGEAREVSDSTGAHHATGRLTPKIPYRGLRRETPPIMATTVGPARVKADNSADRCSIAQNVWLPVRRFHVGTSTKMLTLDAGYTTATDSRVDLPTAFLLCRGRSPYTGLGGQATSTLVDNREPSPSRQDDQDRIDQKQVHADVPT